MSLNGPRPLIGWGVRLEEKMAVQKSKRRVHFVPIVLFCAGDQWFLCPSFVRLVIDRQPTTIGHHPASQGGPGPLQRVWPFHRGR